MQVSGAGRATQNCPNRNTNRTEEEILKEVSSFFCLRLLKNFPGANFQGPAGDFPAIFRAFEFRACFPANPFPRNFSPPFLPKTIPWFVHLQNAPNERKWINSCGEYSEEFSAKKKTLRGNKIKDRGGERGKFKTVRSGGALFPALDNEVKWPSKAVQGGEYPGKSRSQDLFPRALPFGRAGLILGKQERTDFRPRRTSAGGRPFSGDVMPGKVPFLSLEWESSDIKSGITFQF